MLNVPEGIIPDANIFDVQVTQRMAPYALLCCEDQIKGAAVLDK